MQDVIVLGGGLAGLTTGILMKEKGFAVTVLEKDHYPRHKVCGEYVSHEVSDFLSRHRISPLPVNTPEIDQLSITTPKGNQLNLPLDLGGFGISRYQLDHHLAQTLEAFNGTLETGKKVTNIHYDKQADKFKVEDHQNTVYEAPVVVGSFGKLSTLDRKLERSFLTKRSPYIGVKYHIQTNAPEDTIALHHFPGGYCGLSQVEDQTYCFCYLAHRDQLRKAGSIPELEKQVLAQNPFLRETMNKANFLWEKPMAINEISFSKKDLIENHVLTNGDAAGMITPLCGNGMAMAMHSAKLMAPLLSKFLIGTINRQHLESAYEAQWRSTFNKRVKTGLAIQDISLDNPIWSELAISFFQQFPGLAYQIIPYTHGKPF